MSEKKMDLLMRIRANGEQAMTELRKVGLQLEHFTKTARGLGSGAGSVLSAGGTVFGWMMKPLELGAKGAAGLAAGFVAVATKSLIARSNIEQFETRLLGITGSAEGAAAAMAEIEGLKGKRLFEDESLVATKIALLTMGTTAKGAMQSVVDAAAGTGQSLDEVMGAVTSLSNRSLRKMGMDVDKDGEKVVIKYADKMGQMVKITAKSTEEAREKLLGIFGGKFSGSAGRQMEGTLFGSWRNMAEGVDDIMKSFGKGMESAALDFMKSISGKLDELFASGKPLEWGQKVGQVFADALDIGGQLVKDPEKLRQALGKTMEFAAGAFVIYLQTLQGAFSGIAKIMASAFAESLLQMPGMSFLRRTMYAEKIGADFIETSDQTKAIEAFQKLTPGAQAAYLTKGQKNLFTQGINQTQASLMGVPGQLSALSDRTFGTLGIHAAPQPQLYPQNPYTHTDNGFVGPETPTVRYYVRGSGGASSFMGRLGQFSKGDYLPGQGFVVNIQNANFRANDPRQAQNSLLKAAGTPALSPAGT